MRGHHADAAWIWTRIQNRLPARLRDRIRAGFRRAGFRRGLAIGIFAVAACGDGAPSEEGTTGLRFDALPGVAEQEAAPLEVYAARDGTELPVRIYPADSDRTLVLIHGSGYHGRYLAPLARRLAETGAARVLTPDLRGHGSSPERRGDCDYVDQLEDDLADLIDWIHERHPDTRIIVGGHSSGGGLAVRFAGSAYRDKVDGYVLLAPYLGHDAPTARPGSGGWARPRLPVIIGLSILNGFGVTALNGLTAITFAMPDAVRDGTETLAYSYRLNTGFAPRDYRSDLEALEAPVLALIGEEDEAFRAENLGPALREVTRADVVVLPGIGHLDLPAAPRTAERIGAWLASLRPRA